MIAEKRKLFFPISKQTCSQEGILKGSSIPTLTGHSDNATDDYKRSPCLPLRAQGLLLMPHFQAPMLQQDLQNQEHYIFMLSTL